MSSVKNPQNEDDNVGQDDVNAVQRSVLIIGVVITVLGLGLMVGGFARMTAAKKANVKAVGWMIMGIIGIFVLLGGIPMVAVGATKLKT